jgi:hypothetical protein
MKVSLRADVLTEHSSTANRKFRQAYRKKFTVVTWVNLNINMLKIVLKLTASVV